MESLFGLLCFFISLVFVVAVVTVDPLDFDREEYDRLWERMHAHEDAGGTA